MRSRYWPAAFCLLFLFAERADAASAEPGKAGDSQRDSARRMTGRAGCADRLRFELDDRDLREQGIAAALAEEARARVEAAFRQAASALCVAGTLSVATFLGFDRVVLNHAEGAMEPTLYPGEAPRTLIYELYDVYRTPVEERLLREGLLCLANPQRADCHQD